ncbi:flagellar filament capping protein FliD [Lachnospira multipara]|uniref:flagellar filament capping protein FliD n=1 Tax=Lachnospira multipara TaxID=28051 RepID=UPI0004E273CA|nr:flagellar filament capping protein FliD [Lachnospira multipara]
MISSVYDYYLSQYGHKSNAKYDSHTKNELKNTYNKVIKHNSLTPTYKTDTSNDALKYAIDLKENARELSNIANDLSSEDGTSLVYKKAAISSNPDVVEAIYIGDSKKDLDTLSISVERLASNQVNTGNYLQPNTSLFEAGDYSFDLSIHNITYEFQFKVYDNESNLDVQENISRLINNSNIGLSSQILTNNLGNTALSIESKATGIKNVKPIIFNIMANTDTSGDELTNDETSNKQVRNSNLMRTLGLNRISQFPTNASYTINGDQRASPNNDVIYNKEFVLNLKAVSEEPVTVSLLADADSIVESIEELVSGYNKLISVATDETNNRFGGNEKLRKEIIGIANSYKEQLSTNGLTVDDHGLINVDKGQIVELARTNDLTGIFNDLNSFKSNIQKKAEEISLDPMNYVNNKIVAYKNPQRTTTDPYNPSAYSGMMFNGYT